MPPLAERRILVTRARHQASELAARLRALGATPILIPTIEFAPPSSFTGLDHAIDHLADYDWLVFTSANAVEAFHQRYILQDRPPPAIPTAAIGPATARAAHNIGLSVGLVPPEAVAEALASSLLPHMRAGSRVLLVRAAIARDHLPDRLAIAGAHVTVAEAYRTKVPEGSILDLQALFADAPNYPDAITFTSSSTVVNLLTLLDANNLTLPQQIVRASIGPITSRTLCEHGLPPHLQAAEPSIDSLAQILADHFVR